MEIVDDSDCNLWLKPNFTQSGVNKKFTNNE